MGDDGRLFVVVVVVRKISFSICRTKVRSRHVTNRATREASRGGHFARAHHYLLMLDSAHAVVSSFHGVDGYHICLTRRRSPVRVRMKTFL